MFAKALESARVLLACAAVLSPALMLPALLVPSTVAAQVPAAAPAGPPAPVPLQPWQEASVLAALQDPSASVRQEAGIWLVGKQTNNAAIARAVGEQLDAKLPLRSKQRLPAALDHLGPAAVAYAPRLAVLVGDPDDKVSLAAANTLLDMGPAASAAAPQIIALLKSPKAAYYAAQILAKMGPAADPYAPQLAAIAFSHFQIGGAQMLVPLGPAAVKLLPKFAGLLKNPTPAMRAAAAASLGDMVALGSPVTDMAPQVAALLKDPDQAVREEALYALGRMGPAAAPFARSIVALAKDSVKVAGYDVALTALIQLGPAGTAQAPQIAVLLKDPNPDLRIAAIQALDQMRAATPYARQISALLADSENTVPVHAADAIEHLSPGTQASLAPGLAAQLTSADARQRTGALWGLGRMGPVAERYAPNIAARLTDRDARVAGNATDELARLGSAAASAVPAVVAMLKSHEVTAQVNAKRALSKMGGAAAAAVPQLVPMLNEADPALCTSAAEIMGYWGAAAAPAVAPLTALLKSANAAVRVAAIRALGSIGAPAAGAASQLVALTHSTDRMDRSEAATALGKIGAPGAAAVIAGLLKEPVSGDRLNAIKALQSLGPKAAAAARQIAAILGDPDKATRDAAGDLTDQLAQLAPMPDRSILWEVLNASHVAQAEAGALLSRAYLYRISSPQDLILIRWLGSRTPADRPERTRLTRTDLVSALQAFNDNFDQTLKFPEVRKEMADRIAELVPALALEPRSILSQESRPSGAEAELTPEQKLQELALLEKLHSHLAGQYPDQDRVVKSVLDANGWATRIEEAAWVIVTHFCTWAVLIFAYPRFRWVQSFFFWNKWARRFLGLFYVGLLISVVPWLRRRMLVPFKESFLPARVREQLNEEAYFPDSQLLLEKNGHTEGERLPVGQVLSGIQGQIVLKGQSGLGKTLLVLRLALADKEPVVFLKATECAEGVLAAIKRKLHGQLRDEHYLRQLIHAGGLKVVIDGLNEAAADTRARITQFVEESFKGDFILTTQPISWEPPATAGVYVLQALLPEQIEPFLRQQWAGVEAQATLSRDEYEAAAQRYLQSIPHGPEDAKDPRLVALSNPMDASLAAEILATGQTPDPMRLVEQRYRGTAAGFREREGRDFRREAFAERVYDWRRSSQPDIDTAGFEPEVAALVEDRLMLVRRDLLKGESGDEETRRWFFRHDKIMDFFLLPAFLQDRSRRQEHFQDEPFWGVYELLALQLPDEEEERLHLYLVDRAADTGENELMNRYTLARRLRPPAPERPALQPSLA